MVTLQRKIEILEDLEWRLAVIFERHCHPQTPQQATENQYDAYFDLMVNLDNYVDECTEEDFESGDEFTNALIDFIYPEADDLHTGKIMLKDNNGNFTLETCDGVWLANMPLQVWEKSYNSEALKTCRSLLRKYREIKD